MPAQSGAGGSDSDGGHTTNVNVVTENRGHGLVARALWFLFVGWWATGIWLSFAWFLTLTVVGIPLGFKMINVVPRVLTLKSRTLDTEVTTGEDGDVTVARSTSEQPSLAIRAVYFVFVGWWASGLWMALAYLVSLTVVGLPVAVWMYNRLPYVVSLYRY